MFDFPFLLLRFLRFTSSEVALKAQETKGIYWVGAFLPEHKLPQTFQKNLDEGEKLPSKLVITLWPEDIEQGTRSLEDVETIASEWRKSTGSAVHSIKAVSEKKIVVTLATSDVETVRRTVQWFALRPESHWIEPQSVFKPHNFFATQVVQTNARGTKQEQHQKKSKRKEKNSAT